jgi:hypothetical protein
VGFGRFLDTLIPVFQHQSLLMTEVPDRAIYELFQYRRQVLWRFSIRYRVIENIENIHQFAVVFIDLVNPDTQYVPPNNIFHKPSPVRKYKPRHGVGQHVARASPRIIMCVDIE